ncbi:MAG: hypothetical protein H6704_26780 [Myxococcales bacterium]|nr:hypothetical protein [Myxococcales bacterium]
MDLTPEQRLTLLEADLRQTRALARVTTLLLLAVVAVAVSLWLSPREAIDLAGPAGRKLRLTADGVELHAGGRTRAALGVGRDGPQLTLFDDDGLPRAWLALGVRGTPRLALAGSDGAIRATLLASEQGLLLLNGGSGGGALLVNAREEGASLSLAHPAAGSAVRLSVDRGAARVVTEDLERRIGVGLLNHPDASGLVVGRGGGNAAPDLLELARGGGVGVLTATVDRDGVPQVELVDPDGKNGALRAE